MIFGASQKMKKITKNLEKCEKRISGTRVGGTPGVPEELLEFAKNLGRPVPCEQGAADYYPFGSSADRNFAKTWGFERKLFC